MVLPKNATRIAACVLYCTSYELINAQSRRVLRRGQVRNFAQTLLKPKSDVTAHAIRHQQEEDFNEETEEGGGAHLMHSSIGETSRKAMKSPRLSRVMTPTSRPALQTNAWSSLSNRKAMSTLDSSVVWVTFNSERKTEGGGNNDGRSGIISY